MSDLGALRPEDFTADGLPVAMRGYDRRRVEWLLLQASEAYAHVLRQRDALRERTRSLEAEVAAAEGEARVSAASVAELVQRGATDEDELARARAAREELEGWLARVEDERAQAVADLQEATERVAELDVRVRAFEEAGDRADAVEEHPPLPVPTSAPSQDASDEEAARLLLAAVRTAEELRESSRARALGTLKKARERAASVHAEMERESSVLAVTQERRREAERVANEMLTAARAETERVAAERREAERLAAEIGDERSRVRKFLAGALSALEPGSVQAESLLADLSSRLPETGEREDAAAPTHRDEPGE